MKIKVNIAPPRWEIRADNGAQVDLVRLDLGATPVVFRLLNLWVPPRDRRKGIGELLCLAAIREAAKIGDIAAHRIYCECAPFVDPDDPDDEPGLSLDALRRFYTRLGFKPVGNHPYALFR